MTDDEGFEGRCPTCGQRDITKMAQLMMCELLNERSALLAEIDSAHDKLDAEGVARREVIPSLKDRIERLARCLSLILDEIDS